MTELSFPFKSLSLYLKERKYTAGIHQCSDSFWVLYGTRPFREQIKAMYKLMDMVATYQIKLYCLQKPGVAWDFIEYISMKRKRMEGQEG